MLPGALRPATARAAAAVEGKLATRLSPGEKNGRKRMAELGCVYDCEPVTRRPGDIITPPGTGKPATRPDAPEAEGKWLTASVTDDIPAVISRHVRRGRAPRPAPPARMGRPRRRQQHPDRGRRGRGRPPQHHRHDRDRLHPRPGIPLEGRLVVLRTRRARRRGMGRRPGAARSSTGKPPRSRQGSAAAPPPTATRAPNAAEPTPRGLPHQEPLPALRHRARQRLANRHRHHRGLSGVRTNISYVSAGQAVTYASATMVGQRSVRGRGPGDAAVRPVGLYSRACWRSAARWRLLGVRRR